MFNDINLFGTEKQEDNNQIITMYGSQPITIRVSTTKNMKKSLDYNVLIRSNGPAPVAVLDGVHSLLQYFIMPKYDNMLSFNLYPWIPVSVRKMVTEMDCKFLTALNKSQIVHYYVEVFSPYRLFEFFKNHKETYSSFPNKNDRVNGWTEMDKEGKFQKFA